MAAVAEVVEHPTGCYRWVVVLGDIRSAPSTEHYPSESAACAAVQRVGLAVAAPTADE